MRDVRTLLFLVLVAVLAVSSVTAARSAVAPGPAPAPSAQPPRSIASTLQIESSRGSFFGNAHDTVTIVHAEQGNTVQEKDQRIAALVEALREPCTAKVTAADLGLKPELVRNVSNQELGPNVSRGQRRWFDRTFTHVALEDAVTSYYAHYLALDGGFARVRITLSDTSDTVVAAESTAQQALMLPWRVTSEDQSTCTSWNPRISHAVAAYLGGEAANRLDGTDLAVNIAHAYIRQHLNEWTTIPVQERFGVDLKRLSGQYVIFAAVLQTYDSTGVHPERVDLVLQPIGGPHNLLLSIKLTPRGSRLPGLEAALAEIPPTLERLNAFEPIHKNLNAEGYTIWASLPGSLTDDPGAAGKTLLECGANDLAALISQQSVAFVTAGEPSPPRTSRRQSSWAILPDGSAVLWRVNESAPGSVLGLSVPPPDALSRIAALFARNGALVKVQTCPRSASSASFIDAKNAGSVSATLDRAH